MQYVTVATFFSLTTQTELSPALLELSALSRGTCQSEARLGRAWWSSEGTEGQSSVLAGAHVFLASQASREGDS